MKIIINILFLSLALTGYSQDLYLNHSDKELNLGFKYGFNLKTTSYNLTADYIKNISFGYSFDLNYELNQKDAFQFTNFNHTRIGAGIFYNPFNESKTNSLFLHLKTGVFVGYETLKNLTNEKTESKFIFGARGGFQLDWYVIPRTILFIGADQFYTYNAQIGNLHWEIFTGIKFKL